MITYVVLGLLVVIFVFKIFHYRYQLKQAPSHKQLSRLVLSTLRRGQSEHE